MIPQELPSQDSQALVSHSTQEVSQERILGVVQNLQQQFKSAMVYMHQKEEALSKQMADQKKRIAKQQATILSLNKRLRKGEEVVMQHEGQIGKLSTQVKETGKELEAAKKENLRLKREIESSKTKENNREIQDLEAEAQEHIDRNSRAFKQKALGTVGVGAAALVVFPPLVLAAPTYLFWGPSEKLPTEEDLQQLKTKIETLKKEGVKSEKLNKLEEKVQTLEKKVRAGSSKKS